MSFIHFHPDRSQRRGDLLCINPNKIFASARNDSHGDLENFFCLAAFPNSTPTLLNTLSQSPAVGWPEQAHGGIPRAVVALRQVKPPVSSVGQQVPDRHTQRPRQVRDGTVRHDDQVELFLNRRRLAKIIEVWAERMDHCLRAAGREVAFARAFLQTVELHAGYRRQRQKARDVNSAFAVAGEGGVS